MNEKEFLKAFKKHCLMARGKLPKKEMIENITTYWICPFGDWNYKVRYEEICKNIQKSNEFDEAADFYRSHLPAINEKMVKVIQSIKPWKV